MSTLTMRLLRLATLTILLAGSLAAVPGRAVAQELNGNEYTDEEYGWSVEFDDAVWTGEEVVEATYRGLNLSFEDGGFGTLAVYDNGETDPAACLEATADDFSRSDVFLDFESSRSLDAPETDGDAEGDVFTTTYTADDTELPIVFYIECRAVDGGTLNVQLATDEDVYEDALPAFEELLAAIEIETGGGSSTRDETPAPEDDPADLGETDLDAGLFVGEDYPVAFAWDPDVWTEAEAITGTGREGVTLVAPSGGFLQVFSQDTDPDYGADRCLADNTDSWEAQSPDLEEFSPPRGQDIDWPRGAEAAQGIGTITFEDDTEDTLVYSAACVELGDGEDYLIIALTSLEDGYEDNAAALNDLLAELQIGQPASDDDVTPEPDVEETPEPDDEGGLSGNVYVNSTYGWSVEFDEDLWQEVEEIDETGRQGISLGGGDAFVNLVVFPEGEEELDACLDDLETVYTGDDSDELEDVDTARASDPPATSRDAVGELYTGTFVLEDGDLAIVIYLECRAVDGGALTVTVTVAEESYEELLPDLEALLAGIETTGADDVTPEPDEEETPEVAENDVDAGEVDGDTFTDTALNYSVTWDDRVWAGELLESDLTTGVFLITDDEDLFATITIDASLGYDGIDVERCVTDIAAGYESFDGYSAFDEVRNPDGPEAPRDGASGVYAFTFTYEDDTEADLVAYVECRPIDDGSMVRVTIQTTEDSLADNVDVFQEVLDGIEVDGGATDDDAPLGPDDDQEA